MAGRCSVLSDSSDAQPSQARQVPILMLTLQREVTAHKADARC